MKKNVLIAENNFMVGKLMELTLNQNGYTIDIKDNGKDTLKALETNKYDILITELFLPKISGVELIKKLYDLKSDIPILVLSNFENDLNLKQAFDMGIINYILKPINKEKLLQNLYKMAC